MNISMIDYCNYFIKASEIPWKKILFSVSRYMVVCSLQLKQRQVFGFIYYYASWI